MLMYPGTAISLPLGSNLLVRYMHTFTEKVHVRRFNGLEAGHLFGHITSSNAAAGVHALAT